MQEKDQLLLTLLSNDSFVQWVKQPNQQSDLYWQQWMQQSFERKEIAEEARKIMLALNFETAALSEYQRKLLKNRIKQSVGSKESQLNKPFLTHRDSNPAPSPTKNFIFQHALKYAAAIALIVFAGYFFLADRLMNDKKIMQATAYGQTTSLALPDGSSVTLNANSKLEYWPDWEGNAIREVWLEGEAFFSVEQISIPSTHLQPEAQKVKFIVHTDNLDIEVVGTQFNVRSRRGDTEVTLNSGKVKLNSNRSSAVSNIMMKPGDQAQLSAKNDFDLKTVDPEMYSSWRENILEFEDVPLEDIALTIEDIYGYEVTIDNDSLKSKKVNINLFNDDIQKSCDMLDNTLPWLNITIKDRQIIMK